MAANFLIYQLTWLACVMGAGTGRLWLGPIAAAAAVAWHLAISERAAGELKLLLLVGLLGIGWENLLVASDSVRYAGRPLLGLAPVWIVSIWIAFGTTLNTSLHWLKGRPWIAAGLGFTGGPIAWWAGEGLGALRLMKGGTSLLTIGVGWAMLMPLLAMLSSWVKSGSGPSPLRSD
jgi:hypothetical protein